MRRVGIAVTVWLALAVSAMAQPSPLIPREVLFGNPERTQPKISPDGKMLAYLAPENGVLNVWVRTLGKTDDHVVTADKKRGVRSYYWQYDSKGIIYPQDKDGDENWHIYTTDMASKQTRDLTPYEKVRADFVEYAPEFPDTLLVQMNKRDPKLFDVYRVDLKTGKAELDTENPGDVLGWQADHALQIRGAQATTSDGGTIIRVRENAKSPWKELIKWGPDETLGTIAGFTPDNKSLLVVTSADANAARLLQIDIATGKRTVLADDPQYDVQDVITNPKTHKLEGVFIERARRDYTFFDKGMESDYATLKKVRDADISDLSRDQADDKWVVTYVSDDGPLYFYLYNRKAKKATVLFSDRPKLEGYKLSKMEPVDFKARDGMMIHGYFSRPTFQNGDKPPLVLWVHGGPWGRDEWGYNRWVQWMANRGYAVLQVNYRGSTGYGKQYVNAGDREWAGKMHSDLLDGKKFVIENGWADPKKVCIAGGSYGGYATLVGVAFTPDEFACGVDIVGPSNLNTLLASIPPYWATFLSTFHKRMGEDPEFLKSRSPLFKADQIKAPLLIGQGLNDPRVKKAESDQIVQAMRKNNKPVEYYVFPDEGHGFARPQNNEAFTAVSENFLAKYLGGRAEPPTTDEQKLLDSIKQ